MNNLIIFSCLLAVAFSATDSPVVAALKRAFSSVDTDKDNHLSESEFEAIYDLYDKNGDGHLRLAEYLAASGVPQASAKDNFDYYDTNKDGDITKADVKRIFSDYDGNGDDKVTFGEFEHHYALVEKAIAGAGTGVGK
ncbi:calmodulin-like protein 30 [Haliotis rubra]|uniref:calmodulin-like protein 30 n=1 Tax=Haliotis rubra TaxID=36100 RepID=UPI001EE5450E|nr:calmodulin-like protein 30 [Haliotis rubra]